MAAKKTTAISGAAKQTANARGSGSSATSGKAAKKSAKKVAPVKKTAPVKKATPAKKTAPVKKASPARKTAPVKKASPAKKTAPVKKASPAKKATPVKKTAKSSRTAPTSKRARSATATPVSTTAARAAAKKAPVTQARPAKRTSAKTIPGGRPSASKLSEQLRVKDDESPWSADEIAEVRGILVEEIDTHREEVRLAEEELDHLLRDSGDGAGDDQADAGSMTAERVHEIALANNARASLEQAEHALEQLEAGTYGICENCGNPIGKLRLQARPRANPVHVMPSETGPSLNPEAASSTPSNAPAPSTPPTSRRRALFALLAVVAVLAYASDQVSKAIALDRLSDGQPRPFVGEFIRFKLIGNPGAALSLGASNTWVMTAIALGVLVAIVFVAKGLGSRAWAIALGLLLGSAVGNLTDRFVRPPGGGSGHVVDFIDYNRWFIGNVADIWIVSAACLIVLLALFGIGVDGRRDEGRSGRTGRSGSGEHGGTADGGAGGTDGTGGDQPQNERSDV